MTITPAWTYAVTVIKVTDGDTLRVDIDLGFDIRKYETIRLHGINAPELNTVEGKAAASWVRLWVAQHDNLVATTIKGNEKYGRWLAVVTATDDGTVLNDNIVTAGHAMPWSGTGPKPVP